MKTDYKRTPKPNYYIGTTYGYEARRVVEDFELTYNTGTAVSYRNTFRIIYSNFYFSIVGIN